MQIFIKHINASEYKTQIVEVLWEMISKPIKKQIGFWLIIGVLLVAIELIKGGYNTSTTKGYVDGKYVESITYFDLHFAISFGIISCLNAVYLIVELLRIKKGFLKQGDLSSSKYKDSKSEVLIEVNDNGIKYQDVLSTQDLKWEAFSHYTIYKNYIFLLISDSLISAQVIDTNKISKEEATEILLHIKTRLTKKIF